MDRPQHTPGEWKDSALTPGHVTALGVPVAEVKSPPAHAWVDAALIVQAKPLLELVERALADRIDDAWLRRARAVARMARGG